MNGWVVFGIIVVLMALGTFVLGNMFVGMIETPA